MKVSFQGVPGAYSEVAARDYFGESVEAKGYDTSEMVVEAVLNGEVDHGILPIENSIVGSVTVNLDLFYEHNVEVFAENFIEIQHALLSHPDSELKDIEYVYSHPVALAQCRNFLAENNIQGISTYDTAGAAKMIAEKGKKHEAAICSSLCEKYYDLKLLAQNIQNVKDNFTRFFSFGLKENNPEIEAKDHTTLAFMTKHHPGALVNCLTEFSKNFINLTKIESRPIPHNPFEYIFYVDFRGSIDMPETQVVLKELEKDTKEIKIIGSYKRIRKG